jgi:glutamate-5-semialdehyde dehydrogenase
MTTLELLREARAARTALLAADTELKNRALLAMADALEEHTDAILAANGQDVAQARDTLSPVMLDRLALDPGRIGGMAEGVRQVAALPDPVGRTLSTTERPNGLVIRKVSVPMGVIAIIYESRPNVTSDAAALALKAGSACVLRGGREAFRSANAIVEALRAGLDRVGLPPALITLIQDTSRQSAAELMTAVGLVDLLIPRGGAGLIRACVENATVPCIQTGTGICHIYVDRDADLDMALSIVRNAKTSRPSVCNAAEVCLVHRDIAPDLLHGISGLHPGGGGGGRHGRGHRPHCPPLHRPQRVHRHPEPGRRRPVHRPGGQRRRLLERLHPVHRRRGVRPGVRDGHLHPEAPRPGPHGAGGADQP